MAQRFADLKALQKEGLMIFPLSFLDLINYLNMIGVALPFNNSKAKTVQANKNVNFAVNVPPNQIAIFLEFRAAVDTDHNFKLIIQVDGKYTIYEDDDFVENNYLGNPINFSRIGALFPSSKQITVAFNGIGAGATTTTVNGAMFGTIIPANIWKVIRNKFIQEPLLMAGLEI